MLRGEKHISAFLDVIPKSGQIPEEIIPEQQFAPYVRQGLLSRFQKDFFSQGEIIRCVCFTSKGEEWRAACYLWIQTEIFLDKRAPDQSDDIMIGRLLGYSEADIKDFIEHQKIMISYRTADTEHL